MLNAPKFCTSKYCRGYGLTKSLKEWWWNVKWFNHFE